MAATLNPSEDVQLKPSLNGGRILIGLTGGLAVGLSIVCFPFVSPALRKICLPFVPATDCQVKNISMALKSCSGTFVDIGSGDGRLVIAAAKKNFIAHGVELNPWLVHYSRLSAIANRVHSKTSFFRRDLWKFDLRPYNTIAIFGVEEMMEQFETKLQNEVADGTRILACRFPLSKMEPDEVIGEGVDMVWCYRMKRLCN